MRIEVVPYDPRWVEQYEAERMLILGAIGQYVIDIEHAGSTAVPGLAAKPVIDILVGIRDLADASNCIEPLTSLGYEYHPAFEIQLPERRYFKKPAGQELHTHHVHMVETTSNFWRAHILFRDYLRTHPEDAQAYACLKQELAIRFGENREGYTDAKTEFIESVLSKARICRP